MELSRDKDEEIGTKVVHSIDPVKTIRAKAYDLKPVKANSVWLEFIGHVIFFRFCEPVYLCSLG